MASSKDSSEKDHDLMRHISRSHIRILNGAWAESGGYAVICPAGTMLHHLGAIAGKEDLDPQKAYGFTRKSRLSGYLLRLASEDTGSPLLRATAWTLKTDLRIATLDRVALERFNADQCNRDSARLVAVLENWSIIHQVHAITQSDLIEGQITIFDPYRRVRFHHAIIQ